MEEEQYNVEIEKISQLLTQDGISPDEQDATKLEKYKNQVKSDCSFNDDDAIKLVYESLLYMKMKSSDDVDPLQKGDQFGAGFS